MHQFKIVNSLQNNYIGDKTKFLQVSTYINDSTVLRCNEDQWEAAHKWISYAVLELSEDLVRVLRLQLMYFDVKGEIPRLMICSFRMYSLPFIIMAWWWPKLGGRN